MPANRNLIILQEILWLLIAFLVAAFAVYPIHSKVNYIFLAENFTFVVIAVLMLRLVLFFKSIVWLKSKWVRFLLFVFCVNYFVFVIKTEQKFLYAFDSFNISDLGEPRSELSMKQIEQLFHYFHNETHLIVVSCLVLSIVFIIRLIGSHWSLAKTRLYTDNNKFEEEK